MPDGGRQCEGQTQGGRPCQAPAIDGSRYCYFHDPEREADRQSSRRRGGRVRSRRAAVLPAETADLPLKSLGEVAVLLAETINQTRKGTLDCRVANSVAYLAATLARVLEQSDLEKRVESLERAGAGRQTR